MNELHVAEKQHIKGEVCIFIRENGVIVEKRLRNLVVTQGRVEECHIIAGDTPANRVVTNLAVGTGGHAASDPFTPVPPAMGDLTLQTEVFRKAISSHSYPISTTVEFYTIIAESEANGNNITEAGLFCLNNSLFARITFEVIPKTATRTIEFYWRIIY
jgi:hypothetical protein